MFDRNGKGTTIAFATFTWKAERPLPSQMQSFAAGASDGKNGRDSDLTCARRSGALCPKAPVC